ncbi:hypothetical protein Poli38472_007963 [Pythium oligandrum]|uniref:Transmembrane protein n=1 Tax=Pythium oligandrum TaxID=41045 RepID=A0A8K1CMD5_PYTOL|nr:hypothetical protein Poli38472_007963 [Pythium oligandrum]|eukprot:TMW65321.1 hypothetical protein Poli38472_007963 [Pythium oligandrum]
MIVEETIPTETRKGEIPTEDHESAENSTGEAADNSLRAKFESDRDLWVLRSLMLVSTSFVLGILLLTPIFVCLRVDGDVSWDWSVVFIPLWVVDGIVYIILVLDLSVAGPSDLPRWYKKFLLAKSLLLLVVQVFIVKKLDKSLDWSVVVVLVPYFCYDVLTIIGTIYRSIKTSKEPVESDNTATHVLLKLLHGPHWIHLVPMAIRFVQILLIALRIDGHLGNASWWLVFIPLWVALLALVASVVGGVTAHSIIGATLIEDVHVRSAFLTLWAESTAATLAMVVIVVVAPFIILVARLASGSFSTFFIILPWLLITTAMFLGGVGIYVWYVLHMCSVSGAVDEDGVNEPYTTVAERA